LEKKETNSNRSSHAPLSALFEGGMAIIAELSTTKTSQRSPLASRWNEKSDSQREAQRAE
jgi:hypothetical protein